MKLLYLVGTMMCAVGSFAMEKSDSDSDSEKAENVRLKIQKLKNDGYTFRSIIKDTHTSKHKKVIYGHGFGHSYAVGTEKVSSSSTYSSTFIHMATQARDFDLVQELIDEGADINDGHHGWSYGGTSATTGVTPLYLATGGLTPRLLQEFIQRFKPDLNARNSRGQTPLTYTAMWGKLDNAHILLEAGADIHTRDNNERTLLHDAAAGGHLEIVEFLIQQGLDVHARDVNSIKSFSKRTPLHHATNYKHYNVMKRLIEAGADVNARDAGGDTPLHIAAMGNDAQVADLLLQHGAQHMKNHDGMRPSHYSGLLEDHLKSSLRQQRKANIVKAVGTVKGWFSK